MKLTEAQAECLDRIWKRIWAVNPSSAKALERRGLIVRDAVGRWLLTPAGAEVRQQQEKEPGDAT